ncbi:hypothetical protein SPRG_11713 [Saprolegnia parasitica CBS 223.65]|uniref:Uncharacterized protein n=1 Tax=Saprolegnia parasitica (strain CBS 223.65) TaxID=695850 RepID=A0A067C7J8_SAPPC|nr:hypothetical protein SPRG_11713 [Saprolegnia parasitica CBS 223.65]KDO22531.1 hypothetical protein SPRG_11713 [Saprolegnia parasitica CBS 223.65]|eukprot:XP_012206777.1 hypothetical protein SPRG_11713 [Saprolegnia parasitica CBS 223.65]
MNLETPPRRTARPSSPLEAEVAQLARQTPTKVLADDMNRSLLEDVLASLRQQGAEMVKENKWTFQDKPLHL